MKNIVIENLTLSSTNDSEYHLFILFVQFVAIRRIRLYLKPMKKLQPDDQIVKIDEELGIAWILLPPDETLGGFRGISPRIIDEEKFLSAKKKDAEKKG